MSNKHDRPFAEIRFWVPLEWRNAARHIKENPQLGHALRDVAQRVLWAIQEGLERD
jgi:hypothetical protein